MNKLKSLIINPGSTSTKIAIFENDKMLFEETLRHSAEELSEFKNINDQLSFRKNLILKTLEDKNIPINSLNFIMARGGILHPLPSGTLLINEKMKNDLKNSKSSHASNLAAIIASEIAQSAGNIPAMIADPVVVDEMEDVARIAGHPLFERKSIFHALNQKACAKRFAKQENKKYSDLNLIVVHMGGGISVGLHKKGKIVDVNQAIDGEGAFSPERSGTLPSGDLVRTAFSGKYTEEEMMKMINGKGGVSAYLGTSDMRDVAKMIENGDKKAELILNAMVYQIAKETGAMAAAADGKIDAIILTGGIAYNKAVVDKLDKKISFIAPITIFPGEDELQALNDAGLRVINKEEEALIY